MTLEELMAGAWAQARAQRPDLPAWDEMTEAERAPFIKFADLYAGVAGVLVSRRGPDDSIQWLGERVPQGVAVPVPGGTK